MSVLEIAKRARVASQALQSVTTAQKNEALLAVQQILRERKDVIYEANAKDKEYAKGQVAAGKLSSALFKRLDVEGKDGSKFEALCAGVGDVCALDDPTGKITLARELADGLCMYRTTCAVGVICIIFEARPEVVIQISCLALKSGNAVILKGGKEAAHSNAALVEVFREGLSAVPAIPQDAVQFVTSREDIAALLEMDKYVDLVIPRGSNSLVRYIQNNTRIPVLGHADGLCSVYLDASADAGKARSIVVDAKTNYPAACNSAETLLAHADTLANGVLAGVGEALKAAGVRMRACPRSLPVLPADVTTASADEDFDTEFLDLEIAVKVVDSMDEAIAHISEHGSKHTDCIVTEGAAQAKAFMTRVDAAGVYHNASTRFADGFRYGFGAEIGVSTNKTHARGPVGLEGLVIYKYHVFGAGHAAGDFAGADASRHYTHKAIENPRLP